MILSEATARAGRVVSTPTVQLLEVASVVALVELPTEAVATVAATAEAVAMSLHLLPEGTVRNAPLLRAVKTGGETTQTKTMAGTDVGTDVVMMMATTGTAVVTAHARVIVIEAVAGIVQPPTERFLR